jgi:hypothetical protein
MLTIDLHHDVDVARCDFWSGSGYSYAGWSDYAARNGIGCTPGTAIKGGDGIMYLCQ